MARCALYKACGSWESMSGKHTQKRKKLKKSGSRDDWGLMGLFEHGVACIG